MNIFTITVSPFLEHMRPRDICISDYLYDIVVEFLRHFRDFRYKFCMFIDTESRFSDFTYI
jgi:hypothetical protein